MPDASMTLTGNREDNYEGTRENRKYRIRDINRSGELSSINIC